MAFFVIATCSVCSLSAQNQNDTVPQTKTPRTDSMPTKTDTTKASAFVVNRENLRSINSQVKDTIPTDTTIKKDSSKAMAFVINRENLRSLNAQRNDTVPTTDTTKTDSTGATALILNNQMGKNISENNSEIKGQLRVYATIPENQIKVANS